MNITKALPIALFLLISYYSFSQYKGEQLSIKEQIYGHNLYTNSDIIGTEHLFNGRINHVYFDTLSKNITIQLRELNKKGTRLKDKGFVILYDINKNEIKWSSRISYLTNYIQQFNSTIFRTTASQSFNLDLEYGYENWSIMNSFHLTDLKTNIGIGYKLSSSTNQPNKLRGIDLNDGDQVWKRKIDRSFGWNDYFYINDSTIIIAASGLHAVNTKTGLGWDYDTETGTKDYTGTIAVNAVGAVLGVLTGTFVMASGASIVHDVASNTLVDSSYLYFASQEKLAKVNKLTGDVLWNQAFNYGYASKSSLFMDDKTIFMINYGYAFMRNTSIDFGEPFISAYDKETGKQRFLTLLGNHTESILDYQILENKIYLVYKNEITVYSQSSGKLVTKQQFPVNEYGDLKFFVGEQVFMEDSINCLSNLNSLNPNHLFIYTSTGKILFLDQDIKISKEISTDDVNILSFTYKNCKFIKENEYSWIIDNKGNKIAQLNISPNAFVKDDILYDWIKRRLIKIELEEILKE